MRINGQDVRATLDGVGIPFALALHLLQNGAALPAALAPFQHLQGFSFENRGGGTFRSTWSTTSTSPGWVENSDNNGNITGRSWEPDGTVHTNTFEANWSFGAALSGVASFQAQTTGTQARFNEKDQKQYDKKRDEVRKRIDSKAISKKCLDLLTKAGLTVESVLDAINMQNAYDGEKSTISMSNAGYYKKGSLDGIEEDRRNGLLNQQVAKFIPKNAKAATMIYPGGSETSSVAERSDVYFQIDRGLFGYGENSGLTQTTILHEALHSLTGLGDDELYKKLAGKSSDTASADISKLLKDNDCTR